jgi:D-alanine-D-alanine ligase
VRIGDIARLVQFVAAGRHVDLVFNYAAGWWGRAREAQVPALLEALRIPCTGADAFTLTLCIDKAIIKRLWLDAGLPTPAFRQVRNRHDLVGLAEALGGFPLFVKPVWEGSSRGVSEESVVTSIESLRRRVDQLADRYHQPVLVEPYLPGREFSVGLLGTGDVAEVLGVVEIHHAGAHLVDLAGKKAWNPQTFAPVADLRLRHELCDLAWQAYRTTDCRAVGRVDIRMDRDDRPQLLEINPNPGLHPTRSAMPALAQQAGLRYADLIERLLDQALLS